MVGKIAWRGSVKHPGELPRELVADLPQNTNERKLVFPAPPRLGNA